MNIFMAAVYTNTYRANVGQYTGLTEYEKTIADGLSLILESYHYVKSQRYVDVMRSDDAKVFLDSGAFSAYFLGAKLDLNEYCNYIKTNLDLIRVEDGVLMASVLDGIGDPQLTYENQLKMEELGVRPLPCFHYGEDERYLEWYIQNYEYITLGGMVPISTTQLYKWLDRIWEKYLTDSNGNIRVKVHGFGLTSIPLMERYPWHSCDSSSWVQATAFGSIVIPEHGPIAVSEKSPSRHIKGQHVCNLTTIEREYIISIIEEAGFSYERLSTSYHSRAAFNLRAYGIINEAINKRNNNQFHGKIQELF